MKIIIGTDHHGFHMKLNIIEQVKKVNNESIEWLDAGAFTAERSDYPVPTQKVCTEILAGSADKGVLICGSGIGMSIAANRFPGIYAGLAWNELSARVAQEDDNINVLVLPADFITIEEAKTMIYAWLKGTFKKGIYQERLDMLERIALEYKD